MSCSLPPYGSTSLPIALISMVGVGEPSYCSKEDGRTPSGSLQLSSSSHGAHDSGPNDAEGVSMLIDAILVYDDLLHNQVMLESTSHQRSSFNNVNNLMINGGVCNNNQVSI